MNRSLDYLELHTNKSKEWIRSYIELKNLAFFSVFFKHEYGNLAVFDFLYIYESKIANWLKSNDKNYFQGAVAVDKNIGFIIFDDSSTIVTNTARVILAKDESEQKGYIVKNCFPCLII